MKSFLVKVFCLLVALVAILHVQVPSRTGCEHMEYFTIRSRSHSDRVGPATIVLPKRLKKKYRSLKRKILKTRGGSSSSASNNRVAGSKEKQPGMVHGVVGGVLQGTVHGMFGGTVDNMLDGMLQPWYQVHEPCRIATCE